MKIVDLSLIGAYLVVSTSAITLVKSHAAPAMQAWNLSPGFSPAGGLLFLGAVLYAASFLLWIVLLARNELSVIYPVLTGLTLASTTLVAWVLLKENIELIRVLGIGVIFVGLVMVTR